MTHNLHTTTDGERIRVEVEGRTVALTPQQAATFGTQLIAAANQLIAPADLNTHSDIYASTFIDATISKRRHVNLEWQTPHYRRKITIHRVKIRPLADRLHDLADELERRGHTPEGERQ